jgi:hypothetical protein
MPSKETAGIDCNIQICSQRNESLREEGVLLTEQLADVEQEN